MALAIQKQPSSASGAVKDSMPSAGFLRATSVEMVQLVKRTGKGAPLSDKEVPDTSNTTPSDRQLTSIQTDVILRLSQETHKSKVFEIDLSGNAIRKIENVEGFTHVRIIDLACNQLERIENLSNNKELREVRLYANRIARIENLDQLKKLSVLKLQQNSIEQIGDGLQQLRLLEVLRLDYNRLRGIKAAELMPLQNLRVLNISGNQLADINSIICLVKLESLDASHNNIPNLPNLKKCSCLTDVNVSFNRLESLAGLSENNQLITLNISNNAIKALRSLGQCKKQLENLHAAVNLIASIVELPEIAPNLEILDVSKNKLTEADKTITSLRKLQDLMELKCSENPVFESMSVSEIRQALPKLEMINGTNVAKRTLISMGGTGESMRPQTPGYLSAREDSSLGGLSAALLRPKTATTGITIRQLDSIFNNLNGTMQNLERSFSQTFEKVFSTLETEAPRCNGEHGNELCRSCRMAASASKVETTTEETADSPRSIASSRMTSVDSVVPPSPQPSGRSSADSRRTGAKCQSKNALTRRLEQAKSYSLKMVSQTGGYSPNDTKPSSYRQRQSSANRETPSTSNSKPPAGSRTTNNKP